MSTLKGTLLVSLLAVSACTTGPRAKGHLSPQEVEVLMQQDDVSHFGVYHSRVIVCLDNGDIYTAELPEPDKVESYLEHRRRIGRPAYYEVE